MKSGSGDFDDTTRLISGLLDGGLSPDERVRLELRLEKDVETRRIYLQMVDQEIELACLVAPDRDRIPGAVSAVIEEETPVARARRSYAGWWIAAAAAAAIALTAVFFWPRDTPIPVSVEPDVWSADFESGTAPGWVGGIVAEGLPAGSKFGLAAVRQVKPFGTVWGIEAPARWDEGFVSVTPASTLHITWRYNGSPLSDVFLHTLPPGASGNQPAMYRLTGSQFPGPAGQWQSATIPLARFVRKVPDSATGEMKFTGPPPAAGEAIAVLSFSAPHAVDFVIDSIRILPAGSGTESIQPLP